MSTPKRPSPAAGLAAALCGALPLWPAEAAPPGPVVVSGSATTHQSGSELDVTTSQLAVLRWGSFDIPAGATTRFLQPSAGSIVFNEIGGASPSAIFGTLTANGTVILANAQGFYFGPNSMVRVGGSFVATTAPLPPDAGTGASWQFSGLPPLAGIVNYGHLQAGPGCSLFLIAENLENHGTVTAPGGTVGLYGGREVLVSERPDGRGLSAAVTLSAGSIDNTGAIVADAGTIALSARVVNQDGIVQANSVQNHNGVIELAAVDKLSLGAQSQISAAGDGSVGGSAGGTVTLRSGGVFQDQPGGVVSVAGGARGGNGGSLEISAPSVASLQSTLDAGAQAGWTGGRFLLDPANIVLSSSSGTGSVGAGGTVSASSPPGTLTLNVNTAFANQNFSVIDLQASGNITLATGTTWNLSASTGVTQGQLTLQAGGNITFANNAHITDANGWSVALQAGVNFGLNSVQPGVGNIYLNGGGTAGLSGSISTASGSINLEAGQSILVGSGFVRTTAGGDITATALAGDINAGTANGGYQFSVFGYSVSPNLGGISTAAGGNVSLTAGNNVVSTPTVPANQPPGASGAYGPEPGNVTITAGGQVLGNYTVANGTGTILAGAAVQGGNVTITSPNASVGSAQRPVNLSLIDGSWNVYAGGDLFLNEVRNPNGTFNGSQLPVAAGAFPGNEDQPAVPARSAFLFDYAPNAAVNLWAGDAITLAGGNLPRVNGQNQSMPPVYPPCLSLNAGAGGITLENSIILYPSSQGSLLVVTRDGGSLVGAVAANGLTGITMSDSGLPGWSTFAAGHAVTPLHLDDPNPVVLDIAGGIQSFGLTVPTSAEITVAGSTYNFGFSGRNLSPSQTTSIHVAGDITYRGDLTSVALADPLPPALLNPSLSANADTAGRLSYNATTGMLTFIGQMTATELAFLLSPSVLVFNAAGQPVLDASGNQVTSPVALTTAQLAAVQQLYTASQSASLGDQGLALAGPGKFTISARDIDLGISGGITVLPPDAALAAISPHGASLTVSASGSLDMTSTKIANESLGGSITVTTGGTLDVGGQSTTFGDPNAPKGIFTTSGGAITITAAGDVNVDGSRIAAYNGGNVAVTSQTGDVNAGTGGAGYVSLQALELNPATGQLTTLPATIPGSGILATTLAGSRSAVPGDITVSAPAGSINASLGGIIQIAFNGASTRNSSIDLTAGKDINAGGSGIIGGNLKLQAGGDITGVLVGTGQVDINSQHNVDVTAVGGIGVSVSAVGTVSGTIVGPSVTANADTITAALLGTSISTSGNTVAAAIGVPASNVPVENARVADDASTTLAGAAADGDDEEQRRKRAGSSPRLRKTTGRVTVISPAL